jgi:NADPH:quinone reductase-like Zn-dependent oxidoreductase
MKAITHDAYGPPEVLQFRDVDEPVPGPRDVLVRVRAAGVDPGVWHLTTGLPYLMRLGTGLRAPRSPVAGAALAGEVTAVGAEVDGLRPGDRVFGTGRTGAFAEYALARPDRLATVPDGIGFEQAAAVPVSATAALQGLRAGRVERGQRVLVIGAGGGIGSFAVQLATSSGAHVTGVCSTGKVDLVRSVGAVDVIDHTRSDITDSGRFDLILDLAGHRPLRLLRRALTPRGTLVILGGETGGRWLDGTDRQLRAALVSMVVRQRLIALFSSTKAADLRFLAEAMAAGTVAPVLDRTFALADAPAALHHVMAGRARGKVVLSV